MEEIITEELGVNNQCVELNTIKHNSRQNICNFVNGCDFKKAGYLHYVSIVNAVTYCTVLGIVECSTSYMSRW